jgi:hypothetical protein
MRTTVRLDEALLARAKEVARNRGETLTSLLERGLRLAMAGGYKKTKSARIDLPVSKASGGVLPGVDLDRSTALLDRLEDIE